MHMPKKKKTSLEMSKKFAIFSCICFFIVLILSGISIVYNVSDYEIIVTLITVSGTAFSTTIAFYYNKAQKENLYKLKRELLKDRYAYLKEFQVMTDEKADYEMEKALDDLESELNDLEINDETIIS